MGKGNNTAENLNRGKLPVKCPAINCGKDMELVKAKGTGWWHVFVCPTCGNISNTQKAFTRTTNITKI